MGLNLALVLDVSGSMYEEDGTGISRLKRIQDAAIAAIESSSPTTPWPSSPSPTTPWCLLPPTNISEKDKIEDVIDKIDMFDVDPGGTAMDEGMQLALDEVEKHAGAGKLSQVVVLTDGETSGEQDAGSWPSRPPRRRSTSPSWASALDWKATLIKDLAKLARATGTTSTSTTRTKPSASSSRSSRPWPPPAS